MPPGEGRLYRVSPVVLHGGRLLYDENAYGGQELTDDMIIENGATLTIFDEYVAKANIIVKNGSIVNGENGKIQFAPTKRLRVEGQCSISGSAGNKLNLEFEETTGENQSGIVIQEGGSLTIANCQVDDATIGINSLLNADYLNAQYVDFINCRDYTINIAGRSSGENPTPPSQIEYCTITGSDYGISILNLSEINIQENTITNTNWGIFLSSATNVSVIDNQINTNTDGVSGIYVNSSSGAIRGNSISGHEVGIYLANSSPDVGGNDITDCLYHGMYIGDGSIPNMQGRLVLNGGNHAWYATSGYNHIYDNGGYEGPGEDNDGSEIYFNGRQANAIMEKGCNMIIDDREPSPPLINTELLMNCPFGQEISVSARLNYWGETEVTEDRFGNLLVDFGDALAEPCPLPDGSGDEDELIVKSSSGEIIDTVYSIGEEVTNLTATELAYSEAEEKFLSGDMTSAMQLYDGIIASGAEVEEKYLAYERKYEIGRITGQPPEYFNQLGSTFTSLASSAQDSISQKILEQYSILSKVGEQEYEESIGEFDAIIQQNPNTEEAFYAEIDAITTAILIEEADSTLQKGTLGKYLVKPGENYLRKLDAVLRKHFGNGDKESEKETLPTEYTLYQNYPNPFNPLTTIKYDLPNAGDVSLIIYDILGRKVNELVNTKQEAGRYEIQFNASSLASGVYIYQLIAEKYISAKKMILLK